MLVDSIVGIYHTRISRYSKTGKIALCCIAKMENEYIHFFVEYYVNLHFDKIFIYDNNNLDGERIEEVISDYIESGLVEIIDYRGREEAQLKAYQDCYSRFSKEYDWIAFFDCDEFLTFADNTTDIHSFLSQRKFDPFQLIHVNWKVYGDNELLDNDGRNVIERFALPIPFRTKGVEGAYGSHLENEHVKSIVRGGLSRIVWDIPLRERYSLYQYIDRLGLIDPHTPKSIFYGCCNAEGDRVDANSPFQSIHYDTLYLRHYSTKTIGEWVRNKMQRGIPDRSEIMWKKLLNLETFFRYNKKTEEKVLYAKRILEELKNE